MTISFHTYNKAFIKFAEAIFSEMQSFEPSESFFADKRETFLRALRNSLIAEPYSR